TSVEVTQSTATIKSTTYLLSKAFSFISGLFLLSGGVLLLIGAAISVSNSTYVASGVLWIISFSLFILSSLFGIASGVGLVNKISKSPYLVINIIGNILLLIGSILMIIGSALWLSGTSNFATFNSTTIIWVVGSSLIFLYFIVRTYASAVDGIYLYHSYLRNLTATSTLKYPKGYLFSLYMNGIVTTCYLVASTLLLLGSICWIVYLRTTLSESFLIQSSTLWIVSGSLFAIGGVLQMVSRR
ncbi:hypothetical protein AKO1_008321, partial [Acrasis kona]